MVNVEQIEQLLKKHFMIEGTHTVDAQSGVVDVSGNVVLEQLYLVSQLPVSFGHVTGNFWCVNNQLESLHGAPTKVDGLFSCTHNNLISLQGAPTIVGKYFYCNSNDQIISLEGAPKSVGGTFWITYNPQLPLLRLLMYSQLFLAQAPDAVDDIMFKYKGQGKRVMLHCALELKKAGFDRNAKW